MELATVDDCLRELRYRRWSLAFYGPNRENLTAIGAAFRFGGFIDAMILRDEDDCVAFRIRAGQDVWNPETVIAYYAGKAMHALRFVLTLDAPTGLEAEIAAPPVCRIPEEERRPVTIRPLSISAGFAPGVRHA
jgi:hypothetical protein